MNQSREAHLAGARSTPPRGASRPRFLRPTAPGETGRTDALDHETGYAHPARRESRRVDVGNDVGVKPPAKAARARPAGLRSLPAKQHAPKARPSPATDRGRRAVVPGRPSRTNGCAVGAARRRGAGHSPLTAGHRAPPAPPLSGRAWWPVRRGREAPPPDPHPGHAAAAGWEGPGGRQGRVRLARSRSARSGSLRPCGGGGLVGGQLGRRRSTTATSGSAGPLRAIRQRSLSTVT